MTATCPERIVYFDGALDAATIDALPPEVTAGIIFCRGNPVDEADLLTRLDGATVAINGHTPMSNAVLDRLAPTLKRVVFLGTGASTYIDINHAVSLGIEVLPVRDYGSRSIAEFAFGLVLSASRQIAVMDRAIRRGGWPVLGGPELRGKVLGVVGLGSIGREMVRLGADFGMQVVAWNRRPVTENLPCRQVSLEEVFQQSEAISLHVASTPETRGLIGAVLLGRMKPGAVLINVARGEIVDQNALIHALKHGPLAHAALDVFPQEPPAADDPLLALDNVTLTAHAAWNTPDAARRLLEIGFGLARAEV